MKNSAKILVFAGSTRKNSYNKKLARAAAKILKASAIATTYINLNEYPLPLFDGDLESESEYPKNALALKNIMKVQDGFVIASPEYNGSITAVLKNTFDWLSRSQQASTDLSAFKNKIAAIISTSTGKLGGLRGLRHIRDILTNVGTWVIPSQLAIPSAATAFDESGTITDSTQAEQLRYLLNELTQRC